MKSKHHSDAAADGGCIPKSRSKSGFIRPKAFPTPIFPGGPSSAWARTGNALTAEVYEFPELHAAKPELPVSISDEVFIETDITDFDQNGFDKFSAELKSVPGRG